MARTFTPLTAETMAAVLRAVATSDDVNIARSDSPTVASALLVSRVVSFLMVRSGAWAAGEGGL
jgi:hypothetical protein